MNNDAADAAYWHKKYIETLQKAQDYAAKVVESMTKLEAQIDAQESAYQRGYLDGMAKRPQPLTDEQIMNIVDTQRAKVSFDTARVGYKVARAIEKAHDITGEQK